VDYYVELTNRLPYNTTSLTVPKTILQQQADDEEPEMKKTHGLVSRDSFSEPGTSRPLSKDSEAW